MANFEYPTVVSQETGFNSIFKHFSTFSCRINMLTYPNSTNPNFLSNFQNENQIKIIHGIYECSCNYGQAILLCLETV